MRNVKSFDRFVTDPGNRAAMLATQLNAAELQQYEQPHGSASILFLHGPTGTGKSHLISALLQELTSARSALTMCLLEAGSLPARAPQADEGFWEDSRSCDLLVVEDVQHLPAWSWEGLAQVMDHRLAREQKTIFTARTGPQQLARRDKRLPSRLTSRMASGLVIGIQPLQAAGRKQLLWNETQRRQLSVSDEVLGWLAEHLTGGGRQLEGVINQVEQLTRLTPHPVDAATVSRELHELVEAGRPSMERIALCVSGHFRVAPRQLQSRRRHPNILLPRQVGMYLARKLTGLSLGQIGAYFGGRDHSTVLHACRKVHDGMNADAVLSGTVRQLYAELA